MVSGSFALHYFLLGFHGGRQSCRMGRFSIRLSIPPSVCPPLWAIQPSLRSSQPSLKPEAGWLAGPQIWLAGPQVLLAGPQAWLAGPQAWLDGPEGGTNERTYERTLSPIKAAAQKVAVGLILMPLKSSFQWSSGF